jgi:hypothetical protein
MFKIIYSEKPMVYIQLSIPNMFSYPRKSFFSPRHTCQASGQLFCICAPIASQQVDTQDPYRTSVLFDLLTSGEDQDKQEP